MNVTYAAQGELPLRPTPVTAQARQIIDRLRPVPPAAPASVEEPQDAERWDGLS